MSCVARAHQLAYIVLLLLLLLLLLLNIVDQCLHTRKRSYVCVCPTPIPRKSTVAAVRPS